MNDPVVLVTTFDRFEEMMAELKGVLEGHNILIRLVTDDIFNTLFSQAPKDEGTEVQVELSDDAFLRLAQEAHKQDITFNQLVNNILREEISKHK